MVDPDIILLNATGKSDSDRIKIYNYEVHQKNVLDERHAGVAVAIRKGIKYRILDDYNGDTIGIQLDTPNGKINIVTNYNPPRRILECARLVKIDKKI